MLAALKSNVVTVLIGLVAAVVYWKSLSIPPGLYDPLGAGTMPRIVCGGIILFCVICIVQSVFRGARPTEAKAPQDGTDGEDGAAPDRPWLSAVTFGFMVLLAISILFRVSYEISTSLFLFIGIMAVRRFKLSAVPMSALLSIVVGVGIGYLFGSVFSVDLP
jgi:hypothetical protein